MTEYYLLTNENPRELANAVDKFLKEGAELYGNPFVMPFVDGPDFSGKGRYCQAVITHPGETIE